MTTPIGHTPKYDLNGVESDFSGPIDHTIVTLTKKGGNGEESKLIIDSTQISSKDDYAFMKLCVQIIEKQNEELFAQNEELYSDLNQLNKNAEKLNQKVDQLAGKSSISSETPIIEEVHDTSPVDRPRPITDKHRLKPSQKESANNNKSPWDKFCNETSTKVKGFFLQSIGSSRD